MKLTSARRNGLRRSTFGLPSQRKYPMPDRSHAANAKSRASQQYNAGRLSSSQYKQINRKADSILRRGGK